MENDNGSANVATNQVASSAAATIAATAAMRDGLERLLGVAEGRGLSADEEYAPAVAARRFSGHRGAAS